MRQYVHGTMDKYIGSMEMNLFTILYNTMVASYHSTTVLLLLLLVLLMHASSTSIACMTF